MSESAHLDELLSFWQQAVEQGKTPTAEELCRDHPGLLEEFRKRVEALQQVDRLVARRVALDVDRDEKDQSTVLNVTETAKAPPAAALPDIPNYDVLGRLPLGGMAVVYQARDRQLGHSVAIKIPLDHCLTDTHRQRFLDEAKALVSLNHPHIVHLFTFGEHRGRPYMVMELVQGMSLKERITGQAQPPYDAAQLVVLLAQAVQAAHEAGIVHRDLKPGNVLLAPALGDSALNSAWGCPKIADFGLAWRLNEATAANRSAEVAGTASYMALEQAQGRVDKIGPATDVYALGAILYELLTGRPPFRGNSFPAILRQLEHDQPVPPRQLRPELPRDLASICLKCLQKETSSRYDSARSLAEDLQHFLKGEPTQARSIGRCERAVKWVRRKPIVSALLSVIAISLLLALAALWYGVRREDEQRYLRLIQLAQDNLDDGKPSAWARANLLDCPRRLRQWEWFHLADRCLMPDAVGIHKDHAEHVPTVAVSQKRSWFSSADAMGFILVWRSPQGPPQAFFAHSGGVYRIAISPADDKLVSGGADRRVIVWDMDLDRDPKPLHIFDADGPIFGLAVHPIRPIVAVTTIKGKNDNEIVLWNWQTDEKQFLREHGDKIPSLAFSPDGLTLASASHDHRVILWDIASAAGITKKFLFDEHRLPVACVQFSPDGHTVVSTAIPNEARGPDEAEILAWSIASGAVRQHMKGHSHRVIALAFAPGGNRLASGGTDKQIKLWNLDTGQEVLTLKGHQGDVLDLAFTPQSMLISGSSDGTVRLWQAPTDITLEP